MAEPLDRDTRLYLFVNDVTCYLCPQGRWFFYENNHGTATITILRVTD